MSSRPSDAYRKGDKAKGEGCTFRFGPDIRCGRARGDRRRIENQLDATIAATMAHHPLRAGSFHPLNAMECDPRHSALGRIVS
jgi:hypothetical protein